VLDFPYNVFCFGWVACQNSKSPAPSLVQPRYLIAKTTDLFRLLFQLSLQVPALDLHISDSIFLNLQLSMTSPQFHLNFMHLRPPLLLDLSTFILPAPHLGVHLFNYDLEFPNLLPKPCIFLAELSHLRGSLLLDILQILKHNLQLSVRNTLLSIALMIALGCRKGRFRPLSTRRSSALLSDLAPAGRKSPLRYLSLRHYKQ
jgi:hypothetical protein